MRKTFLISKIKQAILFALLFAFWLNGQYRPTLSADIIQIDFEHTDNKEILADDLAIYAIFFGKNYISAGEHTEFMKVLKKWIRDEDGSHWANMSDEEAARIFKSLIREVANDKEKLAKYKNKTVKEVLKEEKLGGFFDDICKSFCNAFTLSVQRGCRHAWKDDGKSNEVTFVLKNGHISAEEFEKILTDIAVPIRLVFENVKGCLTENETVKRMTVSMMFKNCKLTFGKDCFRNSQRLETATFLQSNILLENGAFAECSSLKSIDAKGTNLDCLPPNSYREVLNGSLKTESILDLTACAFYRLCNRSDNMDEIAEFIQYNGMDMPALKRCYKKILREEIENKTEEDRKILKKEFEIREKRCEEIETRAENLLKRNEHLEKANGNLRLQMEACVQKNKKLQNSLEDSNTICEERLNELLRLKNAHKNSKKEHAEAMEKITQELEKNRKDLISANETLEKYKSSYNTFKEEADALKRENEAQKEEIENLKAFKSKWEEKILTFERLETEKNELAKQLETARKSENNSKRMLENERVRNKEELKKKSEKILGLEQQLKGTEKLLFEAQAKIKELQDSELNILTTVGVIASDDEDEKEKEKGKSNAPLSRQPIIRKPFHKLSQKSNRKKGKGWKNFEYSKNDKK